MGNFVSKWVNKSLLGHQNPNDVSNKILSNPYLPKWNQMQEEYRDFNSPYYQKGRDFYSDLYGNQAMDMMATNNNIMNRNLSSMGVSPGGIGLSQNQASFRNAQSQVFDKTNQSLMDMWKQGQQLSKGYGDRAAGLYGQANQMYNQTKAENAASSGAMLQGLIGFGAKSLMPGIQGMIGMKGETGLPGQGTGEMGWMDSFRYGYRPRSPEGESYGG